MLSNKVTYILAVLLTSSTVFGASDLKSAFQDGKISGQVRYYYMSEDNQKGLIDYYGSALGGHIKYETSQYNGFKIGAAIYTSNFINTNVNSTNTEPAAGNKNSRYVIGLMDGTNPDNHNITNVGELYLNYKYSKTNLTLGRMKLKTPFMNPEDGRMIPTLEQGLWFTSKDVNNLTLQAGYINAFWPRSTSGFKSVEDSIGYGYGQGLQPLAQKTKGNYSGNISSNGLYIASVKYTATKNIKLQAWNYYAQNLFNLAYVEGTYRKKFNDYKFISGIQYINEKAVGDDGNADPKKAYMRHGEKTQVYGLKAGAGYKSSLVTFAYNSTSDSGRFMFPREWGKEPFYTFQKRERSEGSGGCHAWLVTLQQNFKEFNINGLSAKLGYGKYYKQDVKNFVLNKYALPSYAQGNIDIFYKFSGKLKGLKAEYLFARKYAIGNTYNNNVNFVFSKVDINIHNFILNYTF
ncbi:MAG TPA: outer membrane porin, OprD family [Arcobacter sp.]|jgi:hypothetical protein|nr:outer membrane porin, OprD family [Arcobacter sp.]